MIWTHNPHNHYHHSKFDTDHICSIKENHNVKVLTWQPRQPNSNTDHCEDQFFHAGQKEEEQNPKGIISPSMTNLLKIRTRKWTKGCTDKSQFLTFCFIQIYNKYLPCGHINIMEISTAVYDGESTCYSVHFNKSSITRIRNYVMGKNSSNLHCTTEEFRQ